MENLQSTRIYEEQDEIDDGADGRNQASLNRDCEGSARVKVVKMGDIRRIMRSTSSSEPWKPVLCRRLGVVELKSLSEKKEDAQIPHQDSCHTQVRYARRSKPDNDDSLELLEFREFGCRSDLGGGNNASNCFESKFTIVTG